MTARPIALAGFMGSGKTTVGRLLAERLGWAFADSDQEVEAGSGRTIADFFARGEEAEFRRLEAEAVASLVERGAIVIALGGGALLDAGTRELLRERARLVLLDVPWAELAPRLGALSAGRPLLQGRSSGKVRELFESRRATYLEAAIRVDLTGLEPAQAADRVLAALG